MPSVFNDLPNDIMENVLQHTLDVSPQYTPVNQEQLSVRTVLREKCLQLYPFVCSQVENNETRAQRRCRRLTCTINQRANLYQEGCYNFWNYLSECDRICIRITKNSVEMKDAFMKDAEMKDA